MDTDPLRPLPLAPPSEAWPRLVAAPADKAWRPAPLTTRQVRARLRRDAPRLLRADLLSAVPKGIVLGLLAFAALFGLAPAFPGWLDPWQTWQWVLPAVAALAVAILFGLESAVVALALAGLWLAHDVALARPALLLVCLGAGACCRVLLEWLA